MIRTLRNLLTDTKGNTLAIFAAALVPLVAMIGSGLDLSFAYMAKAKLQNACDAAVLAGRQSMDGNFWKEANEAEAHKFFDFNFPVGMMGTQSVRFTVEQDSEDRAQLVGFAAASLPTKMMYIFGFDAIPIEANCNAKRDLGHNDVMLVLDTTGSMNESIDSITKIDRLRTGASGLYRALADTENDAITRFGIVSYSHTVNVARSLRDRDILRNQTYIDGIFSWEECTYFPPYLYNCRGDGKTYNIEKDMPYLGQKGSRYGRATFIRRTGSKTVHINNTRWSSPAGTSESIVNFRESGDGCIEERSSIGEKGTSISILQTVSQADIDAVARNDNERERQWGRYDPEIEEGESQSGCPSESQKLQVYETEADFNRAISSATANVTGGTYHDIGMLWGARFLSPTGMFAADNPTSHGIVPVNRHIVFMTDGKLDTGDSLYSAYGIDKYDKRIQGWGSQDRKHINRFHAICDRVKSDSTTIWVIALDVTDTDEIEECASSDAHFYTSDGSDLEQIFERIGRGIGNLRLTR